jgi:hypothetical protein
MVRGIKIKLGDGSFIAVEANPGSKPAGVSGDLPSVQLILGNGFEEFSAIVDKDDAEAIAMALKHMTTK